MSDKREASAIMRGLECRGDFPRVEISSERAPQQAEEFLRQPGKFDPRHSSARVNHDVPSYWYLRHVDPQDFADAPANPVAHDSAALSLFYTGAETAVFRSITADENNELRARAALASAIHRFVFDAAQKTRGTRVAPVRSGSGVFRRA